MVAFFGRMQSGKTSAANFVHGHEMIKHGLINKFRLNDAGDLIIPTLDEEGKSGWGKFEPNPVDPNNLHYLTWVFVKNYNFADGIKWIAINLFGVDPKLCYGTQEDKDTLTNVKWPPIVTGKQKPK